MDRTWFIDFDGTLVLQKSHLSDKDYILPRVLDFFKNTVKENDFVIITTAREEHHKRRIEYFLSKHDIKYNLVICGLPTGPRIVVNDKKPDGSLTAFSFNLDRDEGPNIESINL